jgi:uncharacterized membrane protein HdeD (DUF308 family)
VGLLIGISLLFDGIALLTFGFFARRLGEDAGGF